jgi:hypothetical protein
VAVAVKQLAAVDVHMNLGQEGRRGDHMKKRFLFFVCI